MTTIDAHQHFWDPSRAAYPWMDAPALGPIRRRFAPADLRPLLDAEGIDGCVFVQCRHDEDETAEQLAATRIHPWILGVVGWTDLEAPDVDSRIARLRALPGGDRLVGLRHIVHDEADEAWLARPAVLDGLRRVAAAGLAYDLLVRTRELPAAIAAARAVPEGRFILDHAAKPPIARGWDAVWAQRVTTIAREPNVFCKLSGLATEAPWGRWTQDDLAPACRHLIDVFGPGRLIYGSDWPVCLLSASYSRVKAAFDHAISGLSSDEGAAIRGGNAIATYRLATACAPQSPGGVKA
jgi:L-fuconolactonase